MGEVRRMAVCGPVSPQVSWDRYVVLARWSSWAPQISGVDADAERLQPGLTGRVRTSVGLKVPFVITDVDAAAMTWSWIVGAGPVRHTLHHAIAPRGSGTRATLAIEGAAPLVTAYAPLAWWALRRLVH